MSNIAFAWDNLADVGVLTASEWITFAPPNRLQNKHVARKWRANATTAYIVCDIGSTEQIDTIALMGLSGTAAPTLRFRISSSDTSGAAGDVYDSGSLANIWSANYLPAVHLLNAPLAGRYVRVDIQDSGIEYIEAGRLFIGIRQQFSINFQAGWERMWNDATVRTIGRSGLSFDDVRSTFRSLNLTVDFATETDRWNIMEEVDIALGSHGDMLVITNPASTELGRDSIWGYMEATTPVIEPLVLASDTLFRKTYQIRERL